jgi:hypothetical protein
VASNFYTFSRCPKPLSLVRANREHLEIVQISSTVLSTGTCATGSIFSESSTTQVLVPVDSSKLRPVVHVLVTCHPSVANDISLASASGITSS